ncbi:MAG: twin-arginine translocase subunit TatC [Proteobacteria bacterium]|nr:twin-arginine translocase subunit TatC [Pseudomonadota bacterium]MBQ4358773.1 twin-arginine translocase subunit TatC [Pseudomonadota bacterium]
MSEETQIEQKNNESEMPFYAHFAELRSRLIKSVVAVLIGAVACFSFAPALYALLATPLKAALTGPSQSLIFLSPVEPFFVYLKLSILSGVFLTLPFVFYQIWRFIAPGLYANEKKALVPLVVCSTVGFVLGAVFCYFAVLPVGLKALMGMGMTDEFAANAQISMASYYTLVVRLILAFGVVFEMPIFSYFLTKLGVITHRTLLKYWRIAVVLIFVIAAFLTPPDVITQVALGLPMCLLYVVSIWVAKVAGKGQPAE